MSIPISLMAHLVAGYPTDELAKAAAQGLAQGGVSYFEVQLPFSDPSADGPAIQSACAQVLSRGYTVSEGFAFIAYLRQMFPQIPVYAMTYGNLAYRRGIARFAEDAAQIGIAGLIIPDLPFDHDEGLRQACTQVGIDAVPVAAPSMSQQRITLLGNHGYPYVYASLRAGITGPETEIDNRTLLFLDSIRGSSRLFGGFGIRNASQVGLLAPYVYAVVAGSVFVDLIGVHANEGVAGVRQAVREKARELTGM